MEVILKVSFALAQWWRLAFWCGGEGGDCLCLVRPLCQGPDYG